MFEDVTLPTSIIFLENEIIQEKIFRFGDISFENNKDKKLETISFINDIPDFINTFVIKNSIIKNENNIILDNIYAQVMGVKVYQKGKGKPKQTDYELINNVFVSKIPFLENNYNFISQGIERYLYQTQNEYIKYGEWLAEPRKNVFFDNEKNCCLGFDCFISRFPIWFRYCCYLRSR